MSEYRLESSPLRTEGAFCLSIHLKLQFFLVELIGKQKQKYFKYIKLHHSKVNVEMQDEKKMEGRKLKTKKEAKKRSDGIKNIKNNGAIPM